jgi:RimJ/RimL family protein N-acetyltransferase
MGFCSLATLLLEGRLRRMVYTNGALHDELYFGLTREEFDERQSVGEL